MLVLELDPGVRDQVHHGLVVHDDLAVAGAAEGHRPVVHDLGGQVVRPALGAEQVAALQPWEIYIYLKTQKQLKKCPHLSSSVWEVVNNKFHIPIVNYWS